jgi:nicotinate-nucleotide adenylyltransferase
VSRLALFGGTFDPVHNGHLEVAREAVRLCALDRVLFIPAARPPHKSGVTHAAYEDRYRMVELACAGEPRFEPSRLEEGSSQSYSILTVEKVRAQSEPRDSLFFLIGADAFAELRTWRRWEDVGRLVEFIVVSRPGHAFEVPPGVRVQRLDTLELPVSSSEIRRRLAAGECNLPVPGPVLEYIRAHALYRVPQRCA